MKNDRTMIDEMEISTQIKKAMFQRQVTTAQLAYRLGVSNDYIGGLKRGESCSATTVKRVAEALGMGLTRFVNLK